MSAVFRSMRGPHDGTARGLGPGPILQRQDVPLQPEISAANDNRRPGPSQASALPSDASAIIEPVPVAVNQSGRAPRGMWRLRFVERWGPHADPLMGWAGGGDPLAQIELRFPDLEAAMRYCRREGVPFEVRGARQLRRSMKGRLTGETSPQLCCWPTGPHARCCSRYPAALEGTRSLGTAVGGGGVAFSHSP